MKIFAAVLVHFFKLRDAWRRNESTEKPCWASKLIRVFISWPVTEMGFLPTEEFGLQVWTSIPYGSCRPQLFVT